MGPLTTLLLATPLFGLSLTPPSAVLPMPRVLLPLPAQVAAASGGSGGPGAAGGSGAASSDDADAQAFAAQLDATLGGGNQGASSNDAQYAADVRRRAAIAKIHKAFGISTWAAMGVTLFLGGVQYHNLYGEFDSLQNTPCVRGTAIFGQGQCSGTPWLHLISASVTGALYTTTFTLSLLMPNPGGDVDQGDSDYAKTLRMHELLRWVHLGGMVAQILLGIVIANSTWFGLDRANNFKTLQALATVHLATGLVTYAALTWAGALMVF